MNPNHALSGSIPATELARFSNWLEYFKGMQLDEIKRICLASEGDQHTEGKRLFDDWVAWQGDVSETNNS